MATSKPTPKPRGRISVRPDGRVQLRAYAGKNPVGSDPYIYEYLPVGTDPDAKEVGVALTALVSRADDLAKTRKGRRKDPYAAAVVATGDAPLLTAGAILERWYTEKRRHKRSAGTTRTYLDSYLLPKLADVDAWRLRASVTADERAGAGRDLFDLSDFFDGLLEGGSVGGRPGHEKGQPLAPATVSRCKSYLKMAIDHEMRRPGSKITTNPCVEIELPGVEGRESTTPEPDELAEFLPFLAGTARIRPAHTVTRATADGTKYTFTMPERLDKEAADRNGRKLLAYALLVASGLRPQEVNALQRGNLDRTTRRLRLDAVGIVDGKLERGETDKRRKRTIKLDDDTFDAVDDLLRWQDETALKFGKKLTRRSYIFSNSIDCSTFQDPSVASTAFDRVVKAAVKAGIPIPEEMRLYDMRHYGITQLRRQGKASSAIALRYATSIEMIERTYDHPDPDADDSLADGLAGAWGGLGKTEAEVIPIVERSAQNEG